MLQIEFLEHESDHFNNNLKLGCIKIGAETEKFLSSLEVWKESDYLMHWKASTEQIRNDKFTILVTSKGLETSDCWVFLPIDDGMRVFNSIIFNNELSFYGLIVMQDSHLDYYNSIPRGKISEWSLS